jgi:hypothetical protein
MLGVVVFSNLGYSQVSSDWKLTKELNGVQFYTQKVNCHDEVNGIHKEIVVVKVVNTTGYKFQIKWNYELWYDNKCVNCGVKNKENAFTYVIDADQTLEGDCISKKDKGLQIFSKFLNYNDKAELTKFNIVNVTVNPL